MCPKNSNVPAPLIVCGRLKNSLAEPLSIAGLVTITAERPQKIEPFALAALLTARLDCEIRKAL